VLSVLHEERFQDRSPAAVQATISGAFWLYGFWCVVMYVIVWRFTPETKGRTLEEIEKLWRRS
jgi:hypothetical protein